MSEIAHDADWQRLDPRMLLVHPIKELFRFLPVIIGLFLAGTASGGEQPWEYFGIAIPIGLGLLRYLTTRFRISAGRVELRRGLLNTHVLSTPLDRVRTVDLTSSPIHRLLGLTTVRIGTGTAATSGDEQLDLDGLPLARARELREELLHRVGASPVDEIEVPAERVVVRFSPRWLVYAPLTSAGLVIAAGLFGVGSQILNSLDLWDRVDEAPMVGEGQPWWLIAPLAVVGFAILVSALSVLGYLVTNGGFVLSNRAGAWHLRRGLITTRETSIDVDRVRGVSIGAPLGLRLAGARRLSAIVTGLDHEQTSAVLVPPAPSSVVTSVTAEILGRTSPVAAPLVGHGPRARTRRFTRALVPALGVSGVLIGLIVFLEVPRWFLVLAAAVPLLALALALDRWRSLGHTLVDGWLVVRSGSINQHHAVLEAEGIIGWNLRASLFQRRAGLTTVVATTAGGKQSYAALDVPEGLAVALTDRAVPGLVSQFLDRRSSPATSPGEQDEA
ncbi:PH domain-containing protein [Nocardioides sp.]|uniref:PH domain-containing protein n=1 Tax=Nocardioides sp. TaxID=35761 RepID=UPI003D0FA902